MTALQTQLSLPSWSDLSWTTNVSLFPFTLCNQELSKLSHMNVSFLIAIFLFLWWRFPHYARSGGRGREIWIADANLNFRAHVRVPQRLIFACGHKLRKGFHKQEIQTCLLLNFSSDHRGHEGDTEWAPCCWPLLPDRLQPQRAVLER